LTVGLLFSILDDELALAKYAIHNSQT
jgi:hypothetical protein